MIYNSSFKIATPKNFFQIFEKKYDFFLVALKKVVSLF
jgi:hypothetical protein